MLNEVLSFPGILQTTVNADATNVDALHAMQKLNLDAIVAVDAEHKPVGVVERDQLLTRMMLRLAGEGIKKAA